MENNSKQAVLSIVGIAILVIAVVGVSFAFFTYSRQGTTNNVITTGKIEFEYVEETLTALNLTNQFPEIDTEGAKNAAFSFYVEGTIPQTANPISYTVTAVKGADVEGRERMADSHIDVYVTANNGGNTYGNYGRNADGVIGDVAGNSTNGFQIGYGTIPAGSTELRHNYTLTMWVNDSVNISDTDASAEYRASATTVGDLPAGQDTDTRPVYSDMFYSLKVNVEANDNQ